MGDGENVVLSYVNWSAVVRHGTEITVSGSPSRNEKGPHLRKREEPGLGLDNEHEWGHWPPRLSMEGGRKFIASLSMPEQLFDADGVILFTK